MPVKFLSILLALSLMLCAGCAQAATHTFSGLFSMEYDERVYALDTAAWLDESDDVSRWLCMLSAENYLIDVNMNQIEGWEHLSLIRPDDPMTSWYLEDMLTDGVEHIGNVEAGGALFCLFRTSDADGEFLLGETVANGWAVSFYAYYDEPEKQTDTALEEALKALLRTYQPAK